MLYVEELSDAHGCSHTASLDWYMSRFKAEDIECCLQIKPAVLVRMSCKSVSPNSLGVDTKCVAQQVNALEECKLKTLVHVR